MSHCSNEMSEFSPELKKMFGLGKTNEFPEGKLNEQDEGGIRIAIGATKGKIIIDFGSQVTWVGFTPVEARQIAETLIEKCKEIENE